MKRWAGCVALFFGAGLAGCAGTSSGLITSLEDLTSATERQGHSEVNQNRIISISGLLPHAAAGTSYHYKKSRSPSTAIGMTAMPSYLVESRIKGPELPALIEIRRLVLKARLKASDVIEAKLASVAADERVALEREVDRTDTAVLIALTQEAADARTAYRAARQGFDAALEEAVKAIDVPGVIVMRWQTKDSSSGGLDLGDLFGFSGSEDVATSGFAILGGMRLTTLFVGKEIENFDPGTDKRWDWGLHSAFGGMMFTPLAKTHENARLTTHVFQVQNILYLQDVDIERTAEAKLAASASQLAHLSSTLKEIERIELEYVTQRLQSLSNMGVIGSIERRVFPADYEVAGPGHVKPKVEVISAAQLDVACRKHTGRSYADQQRALLADWDQEQVKMAEAGVEPLPNSAAASKQGQESWHTIYVVDTDITSLQALFD